MLVYVDDVLHHEIGAQEYILNINQVYLLKEGFGPPDIYLGASVDKFQLEDGRTVWSMTCIEYLRRDINNVDSILKVNKAALKFFGDGYHPYPSSYRPILDVTNELDGELTNRFQKIIRVLSWPIELGRIQIMTELSCLSRHL